MSRKYLPLKIRAFLDFILESISKVPSPKVARRVDSQETYRRLPPLDDAAFKRFTPST